MNMTAIAMATLVFDLVFTCAQPIKCFPPIENPYEIIEKPKEGDENKYTKYQRDLYEIYDFEEDDKFFEDCIKKAVPYKFEDEHTIIK